MNPWKCEHKIVAEDCSFDYEYGSISATHEEWELRCKHCDMPVDGEQAKAVDGREGVVVVGDAVYSVWYDEGFYIENDHTSCNAPEEVYKDYFMELFAEEATNDNG